MRPNEVDFKLTLAGHHRRRLFDRRDYIAGYERDVRGLLRDELIRATGDTGLFVRSVELGYIEPDGRYPSTTSPGST